MGLHHVGDDGLDIAAVGIDPVDVAGADLALGLVALIVGVDAVGRIGEPDRAVGFHHHVVGRVQPLALPFVGDGGDRAVMLGAADAAARMLASDQPALPVDGVAVGIARRLAEHADAAVGLVVAQHAVVRDVGPDDIAAGGEPGRAFRPAASGEQLFHLRVAVEQAREARIENFIIVCGRHAFPPGIR